MTTYLIRGFTGPNADFSFTVHADIMPYGDALKDIVLRYFRHECDWVRDLASCDVYSLSENEERIDLRDDDTQRVYLFSGEDCIVHDGDDDCDGNNCVRNDYMITVDIEQEAF